MNVEDMEDAETLQHQALEIQEPGEDFDPTAIPQTGEQYLTHMLYERRKEPAIVVRPMKAENEKPVSGDVLPTDAVFKLLSEQSEVIAQFKQSDEWKKSVEEEFQRVRKHFKIACDSRSERKFGEGVPTPSTEPHEWIEFCRNTKPHRDMLERFNQQALERLLTILYDWLREQCESAADDSTQPTEQTKAATTTEHASDGQENAAETDNGEQQQQQQEQSEEDINMEAEEIAGAVASPNVLLGKNLDLQAADVWYGVWLYAALIAIDPRLDPETLSTIRQIARLLIFCRLHIKNLDQVEAQPHNMLIYIIAKEFGQLDFLAFV